MVEKKKKIMLLGGLRYLIPVIEAAHELGLHVITCDYLPNNIAHKYSDEYHNVSIIDKEAVLKLARDLQIDGIMSFAVDPGVVTAAYVQEKMGLPSFGPYESVRILQDKARFREFLRKHGFNCPWSYGFDSVDAAMAAADKFTYPAIVKPTDAAGSKGVSRVDSKERLLEALEYSMKNSIGGGVIVEQFLENLCCPSDSDCFSIDGKLVFASFSAQRFDEKAPNPFTPSAFSWPSCFGKSTEYELKCELQRLLRLLGMKTSVYNVESRIAKDGKAYLMEVSPRGGGNRLSEMLVRATGVPIIENTVRACVGLPLREMRSGAYKGHWLQIILHSGSSGFFSELYIRPDYQKFVVEVDLWIVEGEYVNAFNGANSSIGVLIMCCDSPEQVELILSEVDKVVSVRLTS